jgi:two-component system cell cycle sensor histidine kinase/response regulator CckA
MSAQENPKKTIHKRRSRSLSREVALSLFVILILVEGFLLLVVYQRQLQTLRQEVEAKADDYIQKLSDVLAVPVWNYNDEQITKVGNGFLENALVDEIWIRDLSGQTLFHSSRTQGDHPRVERMLPIAYNNQKLGEVSLSMSLSDYRQQSKGLRNTILLILAGSLAVILIATGLLLRITMRKPINILLQGMDRLARGDYDYRFEEIQHVELSGIADRFTTMASEIKSREASLQELNRNLQDEIDVRKHAEAIIRDSEAKSLALLDALPDTVFQVNREGRIIDFKGTPGDGFPGRPAVMGRDLAAVLPAHAAEALMQKLNMALKTQSPQIQEYSIQTPTGEAHFEARLVAVGETLAVGVVRNITQKIHADQEKTRLEADLRQAHKMEAVGTLAGGIAHDFNNILAAIMGYVEIAKINLADRPDAMSNLDKVLAATERAKTMVNQILAFSRKSEPSRKPVSLGQAVKDALDLLRSSIPKTIEFQVSLDAKNDIILGDSTQIQQVLMNLCTNAAHAMEEKGGILSVATKSLTLTAADLAQQPGTTPGPHVQVSVTDTGHGIPENIRDRIFDPYFTNKSPGKGTGMGLAVVHGIVRNHGGAIHMDSTPGVGTMFSVQFPLIDESAAPRHRDAGDLPKGSERVFFVDDEPELVDIAAQMLNHLGYRVTTFSDPREALAAFEEDPERVDLVITDLTMPHMTGTRLVASLQELRPGIPILLCTGYSDTVSADSARGMGISGFMMKPLSIHDMAAAIRRALASPPQAVPRVD